MNQNHKINNFQILPKSATATCNSRNFSLGYPIDAYKHFLKSLKKVLQLSCLTLGQINDEKA